MGHDVWTAGYAGRCCWLTGSVHWESRWMNTPPGRASCWVRCDFSGRRGPAPPGWDTTPFPTAPGQGSQPGLPIFHTQRGGLCLKEEKALAEALGTPGRRSAEQLPWPRERRPTGHLVVSRPASARLRLL